MYSSLSATGNYTVRYKVSVDCFYFIISYFLFTLSFYMNTKQWNEAFIYSVACVLLFLILVLLLKVFERINVFGELFQTNNSCLVTLQEDGVTVGGQHLRFNEIAYVTCPSSPEQCVSSIVIFYSGNLSPIYVQGESDKLIKWIHHFREKKVVEGAPISLEYDISFYLFILSISFIVYTLIYDIFKDNNIVFMSVGMSASTFVFLSLLSEYQIPLFLSPLKKNIQIMILISFIPLLTAWTLTFKLGYLEGSMLWWGGEFLAMHCALIACYFLCWWVCHKQQH